MDAILQSGKGEVIPGRTRGFCWSIKSLYSIKDEKGEPPEGGTGEPEPHRYGNTNPL